MEELGVDGMKTDGGEHLWSKEARFSDGRTGEELWNLYPCLYEKAYSEFFQQYRGDDWVLFSRSGFTGAQKYSCHWAGDEVSSYLVAPVVEPGVEEIDVYLPEGAWNEFWSRELFHGPQLVRRPCPIDRIAVFERGS